MIIPIQKIWNNHLKRNRKKVLFFCLTSGILALGLIILSFFLSSSWQIALIFAVLSAGVFCWFLYSVYSVYLPFTRTERLLSSLDPSEEVEHSGTYLGKKSTGAMRDGVRMQVLRTDEGESVRGEPVESEPELPAIFRFFLTPGSPIRYTAVRGIITGLEEGSNVSVRLSKGRLSVPLVQYLLMALLALILWLGGYEIRHRLNEVKSTDVAVCTLAYHSESESVLQKAADEQGLSLSFAYTTTLDQETVYQYLATHGTFESELLLLSASDYLSAFDRDTPALYPENGVRFLENASGQPVAAVLYDPEDPVYSKRFASVADWIAIPKNDLYVLAIGPGANETASEAASLLINVFTQDIFPKE